MRRGIEVGVVSGYAAAGALAAGLAVALGRDPIRTTSWVGLEGRAGAAWSLLLGGLLAAFTVIASRILTTRTEWGRALHEALRPAVRDADGVTLGCMALASGVGEELFFRGLLVPLVGVIASSIGFGLLHQVRGPARWAWAGWAGGMGMLFALVFTVTGSLAGSVLAHVAINAANLRYVRDVDPGGSPRLAERGRRFSARTSATPPGAVPRGAAPPLARPRGRT
jgi:membrane protease YdiL (CAAX protease family)